MDELLSLTKEVIALVNKHERFRAVQKSLRSHTDTDSKCDELELDFEVIGIPQHRLVEVRNIEPIKICISKDDTMPIVKVRNDFPSVPHLSIHKDNVTKNLCYTDLRYEEIKHKMCGRFLLTCIENWFLKTSMNELHRPDQPIEPFFPYVNNVIIWNECPQNNVFEKFLVEEREFGKLMYRHDNGEYYAIVGLPVPQDYSNLIHNMPQTLLDLLYSFENTVTIRRWLGFIGKIIRNVNLYKQYFNQSKNALLACKVIINVAIPKSRAADEDPESHDLRTFVTDKPLKDILADYGLVLRGSKIEDSNKTGGYGANITIQQFNVHFECSRLLNKLLNKIDIECGNEQIALIGAGAIGSQILNNFLREGYGKWTIIDNDYFWPHNIARHILTSKDVGYTKSRSLAKLSASIQSDSEVMAITDDVFSDSEAVRNALGCSEIIIDASASIAVERHIALDVKSSARRVSCFLNPKGTATVMLLGSTDGDVRLDQLEMQYYRELVSNPKYSDHMLLPENVVYSGTCRSITSRMLQDNVSLSAALCSKALKMHLADENGKIIIWTHENDSVSRDIFTADNWITYKFNEWTIEISEFLLNEIKNDRAQSMPKETGGVLIGAFDLFRKRVYIVCQIEAPDDSISSPTSFIRGCKDLPQRLNLIQKVTMGNLSYIGEWHSHTNSNTQKSSDDEKLHKVIVDYNHRNCIPGCMMIVGWSGYSIYIDE